jgi:MFS family permease
MAETIRNENRGKAMGSVQSAWSVGWGAAVLLYALMFSLMPAATAWRVMFGIGIVPALLILYVRRGVQEPSPPARAARDARVYPNEAAPGVMVGIFSAGMLRMTLIGALLGVGAHGGYYALMTWLRTFLKSERHLSVLGAGGYLAVVIVAFFCGCLVSAQLLDRIGRRKTILVFAICCVITVVAYLFLPLGNIAMLFFGFPLGFFAAGIPASMGALFNELYPRGVRGTGVGFCYNFGRVVSAGRAYVREDVARNGDRHRRGSRLRNRRVVRVDAAGDERPRAGRNRSPCGGRTPPRSRAKALTERPYACERTNH